MILKIIKITIAIAIFAGFLFVNLKQIDPDLGWHLRIGEQIMTTGEIPRQDTFSHTMPGFEWVNHEWLVDAWFWWMQIHNLWLMVVIIFALLAFLPFLVWIVRAEHLSWLWFILLAALTFTSFIGVRPQIISFFIFFAVFEILRCGKPARLRWIILPIIFFIWANLHGGFFAGLVLFGCYLIAYKFPKKLANWKFWKLEFHLEAELPNIPRSQYVAALTSFVASVLATLINPHGWRLYSEILTILLSSDVMKYISEWASVASSGNIPILIFLASFLTLFIHYWRQYPIITVFPLVIFFIMGVKSVRNFPLLIIIAMPFLFSAIEFLWRDTVKSQERNPFSARTWAILRLSSVALFVILIGYFGYVLVNYQGYKRPEKAADFMEQKIKTGEWSDMVLLNDYNWGGYLIGRMPEIKIFVDGRMPHWVAADGNSAMKDYIAITKPGDIEKRKSLLEKRKINTIITANNSKNETSKNQMRNDGVARVIKKINTFFYGEANTNLKEELLKNEWEIAYEDSKVIILRK